MGDKSAFFQELEASIQASYESGVTMEEAEKLAGKFLTARLQVSAQLTAADLDRRMRKRGLKAIKSAVRTEEVKKYEKKPTEGALDDVVNLSELVAGEEQAFDEAEVKKEELERLFEVFQEAHIHFRTIAKGRFEG